jgi:formate dehydrogenase assembly factor FdhD
MVIQRVDTEGVTEAEDDLATEEPLEIVLVANENNMTLIGFLKKQRFNVYSGFERVEATPSV